MKEATTSLYTAPEHSWDVRNDFWSVRVSILQRDIVVKKSNWIWRGGSIDSATHALRRLNILGALTSHYTAPEHVSDVREGIWRERV